MRWIIGTLTALAFGGLAVEIGLKLGSATLTLVLVVALGVIGQGFAIALINKRNAKRQKDQNQP